MGRPSAPVPGGSTMDPASSGGCTRDHHHRQTLRRQRQREGRTTGATAPMPGIGIDIMGPPMPKNGGPPAIIGCPPGPMIPMPIGMPRPASKPRAGCCVQRSERATGRAGERGAREGRRRAPQSTCSLGDDESVSSLAQQDGP
jgi:hypothetical protein